MAKDTVTASHPGFAWHRPVLSRVPHGAKRDDHRIAIDQRGRSQSENGTGKRDKKRKADLREADARGEFQSAPSKLPDRISTKLKHHATAKT